MCQRCVELVHEILPDVQPHEMGRLLFETTCFPFGEPEHLEPQLRAIARTARDMGLPVVEAAYRLTDADWELEGLKTRDWR